MGNCFLLIAAVIFGGWASERCGLSGGATVGSMLGYTLAALSLNDAIVMSPVAHVKNHYWNLPLNDL